MPDNWQEENELDALAAADPWGQRLEHNLDEAAEQATLFDPFAMNPDDDYEQEAT